MFERVALHVSDLEESRRFYETVLAALELASWGEFTLTDEPPVTQRLHIGFRAPTRAQVDAFWQAGVDAGYRDDGAPGPRPQYGPDYYGGFLLDPDGNSAEAVTGTGAGRPGVIDHLWLRSEDLPGVRRFWIDLAPRSGFELGDDEPDRVQFVSEASSFSFVSGPPSAGVHLVFSGPPDDLRDPEGTRVQFAS